MVYLPLTKDQFWIYLSTRRENIWNFHQIGEQIWLFTGISIKADKGDGRNPKSLLCRRAKF